MRFGVTMLFTDRTAGPAEVAPEVEARGFDSFFVPEHTHIPVSRRTPAPLGEPLPEEYRRMFDPFVALSVVATVTSRIRLGTAVCLVAQRDPIVTAKEVSTLDHLSGGRFVFGVGFGWNVEEAEDHGVDFRHRREVAREKVLAMQRLWAEEVASFQGRYVRIEPSWMWPKPVQRPRPPVLLGGGAGPTLFAHLAEYGDGWMPIGGRGVAGALPALRRRLEEAGRDPTALEVVPVGSEPDPAKLEYFRSVGVTEVVFRLPSGGRDEVLRALDALARVVEVVGR